MAERRVLAPAALLLAVIACAPAAPPVPTTPAAKPPAAAASPAPAAAQPASSPQAAVPAVGQAAIPGAQTAAELAAIGEGVYQGVGQCAVCHGQQGEGVVGPPLVGPRASLTKFGDTAAGYFLYTRSAMPQTAPGSLSEEQYLAVTTYLLLKNNIVQPSTPISLDRLDQIRMQPR